VRRIEVDLVRAAGAMLRLNYRAVGTMAGLAIPARAEPIRADRLWEHTCFEVFLRRPGDEGYVEFNFSPSGAWAAYRFTSQRRGMSNLVEFERIPIGLRVSEHAVKLEVELDLGRIAGLIGEGDWSVGVSTIIEETGGKKSYWALAHPEGKADFHHPDSFALTIEPVTAS
jgi:hypothetical protein